MMMKHIAWINKKTNKVWTITAYGPDVNFAESDTSYPVEVQEGSIPEVGMIYNSSTGTFVPAPPKMERPKRDKE